MKTTLSTLALLALASFAVLDAWIPNLKATQRWEYKTVFKADLVLRIALDKLGAEGWELVFARRARADDRVMGYEMIFKRSARALEPEPESSTSR